MRSSVPGNDPNEPHSPLGVRHRGIRPWTQDGLNGNERAVLRGMECIGEWDVSTHEAAQAAGVAPDVALTALRSLEQKGIVECRMGSVWAKVLENIASSELSGSSELRSA